MKRQRIKRKRRARGGGIYLSYNICIYPKVSFFFSLLFLRHKESIYVVTHTFQMEVFKGEKKPCESARTWKIFIVFL